MNWMVWVMLGIFIGVLMLGLAQGCQENLAYNRKPCDNCGLKAEQYMDMNLKLCPVCAGKLYELKNKKAEENDK